MDGTIATLAITSAKATETAFKNFIASSLWIYQID
jgi:hypothetical protein